MNERILTPAEADDRIIPPDRFVPDDQAFVDVRLPDSAGKDNYAMIGPGVSQNPDQHINLPEPHGFNVGAAGVPAGGVNNQHLHFTAEVFVSVAAQWEFRVGLDSGQTLIAPPGSVISIPTWIFRGFRNLSDDYAMLYAVLGGDDTGGIIWSPKVLQQAALTGLYLRLDNTLLDTTAGDELNGAPLAAPMSEEDMAGLRTYTDAELRGRLVTQEDLEWSERALLDSVLPGHSAQLAPVLGWGMTMDRDHVPPMVNPHTFSIEWLWAPSGNRVGAHRHDETQVLMAVKGEWEVLFNRGANLVERRIGPETLVSVPPGVWRSLRSVGGEGLMLVVNGGDSRNLLEWEPQIAEQARAAGWAVDAGGYIAPERVLLRQAK